MKYFNKKAKHITPVKNHFEQLMSIAVNVCRFFPVALYMICMIDTHYVIHQNLVKYKNVYLI